MLQFIDKFQASSRQKHHQSQSTNISRNFKNRFQLKQTPKYSQKNKEYYLVTRPSTANQSFSSSKKKLKIPQKIKEEPKIQQKNIKKVKKTRFHNISLNSSDKHQIQTNEITQQYDQWKIVYEKIHKQWNQTLYSPKIISNLLPPKKDKQKSFQIKTFEKNFDVKKLKKPLKFNPNTILYSQLYKYDLIVAVNTQNKNYSKIKIQQQTDYTNCLKNMATLLNQNSSSISKNIYFCLLMGQKVQTSTFFWVGTPLMFYDRQIILKEIKRFLPSVINSSIEQNQSWTIWIVDWKGRYSFITYQALQKGQFNVTQQNINQINLQNTFKKRRWKPKQRVSLHQLSLFINQ